MTVIHEKSRCREGDSTELACCLSAIKKANLEVSASQLQNTETDAVHTNDSCISECPPTAFSACCRGRWKERLHAELSGERAELPRQSLDVYTLQNHQLCLGRTDTVHLRFRSQLGLQDWHMCSSLKCNKSPLVSCAKHFKNICVANQSFWHLQVSMWTHTFWVAHTISMFCGFKTHMSTKVKQNHAASIFCGKTHLQCRQLHARPPVGLSAFRLVNSLHQC